MTVKFSANGFEVGHGRSGEIGAAKHTANLRHGIELAIAKAGAAKPTSLATVGLSAISRPRLWQQRRQGAGEIRAAHVATLITGLVGCTRAGRCLLSRTATQIVQSRCLRRSSRSRRCLVPSRICPGSLATYPSTLSGHRRRFRRPRVREESEFLIDRDTRGVLIDCLRKPAVDWQVLLGLWPEFPEPFYRLSSGIHDRLFWQTRSFR